MRKSIVRASLTLRDLPGIKMILCDCDGVLWRGLEPIPGVNEAFERIRATGLKLRFFTNCALRSIDEIADGFQMRGITLGPDEKIYSATSLTLMYLKEKGFIGGPYKVYCIGEAGFIRELRNHGITVLGGQEDDDKVVTKDPIPVDPQIRAVVVGGDRGFNYYKFAYAHLCISTLGAEFISTNPDAVSHMIPHQEWPCTGSQSAALEYSTGVTPTLIGKPSPIGAGLISKEQQVNPEQILMIGDNLNTDIQFAITNGMKSVLVFTGVTKPAHLEQLAFNVRPTFYMAALSNIFLE